MTLLIFETTNQTESEQIKPDVGFLGKGDKPGVPGEKPLRVENQQTQSTYCGQWGNRMLTLLVESESTHLCANRAI